MDCPTIYYEFETKGTIRWASSFPDEIRVRNSDSSDDEQVDGRAGYTKLAVEIR